MTGPASPASTTPSAPQHLSPARKAWSQLAAKLPWEVRGSGRVTKRLLADHGYLRSWRAKLPVDRTGRPVPWYTFPAVEYLEQLDFSGRRVLEMGSGNSTCWWLAKGATVEAVENDPEWYERMKPVVSGPTMTYHLATDRENYLGVIDRGGTFDVIIVDGYWRGECAERAPSHLAEGGMVIVDNSDWFPDIAAKLRDEGLLEIDFHGFIPLGDHSSTTSVFLHRSADFRPVDVQPRSPRGGVQIPAWRRRWFLEDPGATPDGA